MQSYTIGIDVSWHRGEIAWPAVKASGIDFAFVKATEGVSFLDSRFYRNWGELRRAGILRGAYHFFRPALDPVQQAQHFINTVGGQLYAYDLPPVLDVENSPDFVRQEFLALALADRRSRVLKWLDVVERGLGRTPILYTNPDTWFTSLGDSAQFARYPLWIANYGVSAPLVPAKNWNGRGWSFWQFTDRAAVPGVNGGQPPTDKNFFRGNRSNLLAFLGLQAMPSLPPAITYGELRAAAVRAATQTDMKLVPILSDAGLEHLLHQSLETRPYDGPPLVELELPEIFRSAWLTQVDLQLAEQFSDEIYPLYRLTNQEVINRAYRAAGALGMPGWQLLDQMKLAGLVNARQAYYAGPRLDQMDWLSESVRSELAQAFEIELLPIPASSETYSGISNQDVINAIYRLATRRGQAGWAVLVQFKLEHLVAARAAPYTGPQVGVWPGLATDEHALMNEWLGQASSGPAVGETYPGLINQDMINVFYRAASQLGTSGWALLARASQTGLAASPATRNAAYAGPAIADLAGLSLAEKEALAGAMARR